MIVKQRKNCIGLLLIRCSSLHKHFQFFNAEHPIRFTVQHPVAVRAYWHQIAHRIHQIVFADFADGLDVIHFDFSGKCFPINSAKIKRATAMSAPSSIDCDARLSTADRATAMQKTVKAQRYWEDVPPFFLSDFCFYKKNASEKGVLLSQRRQKK